MNNNKKKFNTLFKSILTTLVFIGTGISASIMFSGSQFDFSNISMSNAQDAGIMNLNNFNSENERPEISDILRMPHEHETNVYWYYSDDIQDSVKVNPNTSEFKTIKTEIKPFVNEPDITTSEESIENNIDSIQIELSSQKQKTDAELISLKNKINIFRRRALDIDRLSMWSINNSQMQKKELNNVKKLIDKIEKSIFENTIRSETSLAKLNILKDETIENANIEIDNISERLTELDNRLILLEQIFLQDVEILINELTLKINSLENRLTNLENDTPEVSENQPVNITNTMNDATENTQDLVTNVEDLIANQNILSDTNEEVSILSENNQPNSEMTGIEIENSQPNLTINNNLENEELDRETESVKNEIENSETNNDLNLKFERRLIRFKKDQFEITEVRLARLKKLWKKISPTWKTEEERNIQRENLKEILGSEYNDDDFVYNSENKTSEVEDDSDPTLES